MTDTLRDAYAEIGVPERRGARKPAVPFKPDEKHEAVLSLRDADPVAYARLSATVKLAAASYLEARTQAEQEPGQ